MSVLHLSKVAFGCSALAVLETAIATRQHGGVVKLTTRYLPKRHVEILNGGSLYWIIKHQMVARANIVEFEPTADGKHQIILEAKVIPVSAYPKRAHQGWRYLDHKDAPPDLDGSYGSGDMLSAGMLSELSLLSLI